MFCPVISPFLSPHREIFLKHLHSKGFKVRLAAGSSFATFPPSGCKPQNLSGQRAHFPLAGSGIHQNPTQAMAQSEPERVRWYELGSGCE